MQEKDVVFISWSGKETASYRMANTLYQLLPMIFQSADFFMSEDISKGSVGISEILKKLGKAKIGIFCITKINIEKPWLNFEAGALASAVENKGGKVIPLLIDMTTDEFAAANSPIRNYQGTVLEETDLLKMFLSINENLGTPLKEDQVKKLFDTIAKPQILECDTTLSDVKKNQDKHSSEFESGDPLTKDCKRFFRRLYEEYLERRKNGVSREQALSFGSSKELSDLLKMPCDDVDYFLKELKANKYINCSYADNMVYNSFLNVTGIKYCEDNFDEPSYMFELRKIISKYHENGNRNNLSTYGLDISKEDLEILESKEYIQIMSRYKNGFERQFSFKLLPKAFEFEKTEF